MSPKTIEIRDVGPVTSLSIPIPDGGGVVVLRGKNGDGKSHSLQAVNALVGGKARPVSRDGSLGASIEGLGARLTVGRRSSHSGQVEVSTIEGEDPSLLVDPGIKSPAAADAKRLQALLRLSGKQLDIEAFAELVGGTDRLRELCRPSSLDARDDAVSMVAAVKSDLEGAARKLESAAENSLAKADGIRASLEGFGDDGERQCSSTEAAREAHTAAVRDESTLVARRAQNQKLLDASQAATAALDAMGEAGKGDAAEASEETERNRRDLSALGLDGEPEAVSGARSQVARSRQRIDLVRGEVEEARVAVERARAEVDRKLSHLSQAEECHGVYETEVVRQEAAATERAELTAVRGSLQRAVADVTQRVSLQRAVDAAAGAVEITQHDLDEAARALLMSSNEVDAWVLYDKTRSMREEAEEHDARGKAAAKEGDALRRAAHGTEGVMMKAVRAVCGEDMGIKDGRIFVNTGRGQELFCELSPGERWRRALDIAVKAVGHKGLLVIRQEAWEAMDPHNRQEVAAHAQALGVVVLTAECDAGDIRAEVEGEVVRA